jgi:hypothetical protein
MDSWFKKLDKLVRRSTVRLLIGSAGWVLEAASWLCTKVFGIETSHVLLALADIEDQRMLTLQSAQVHGSHLPTTLALMEAHSKKLAEGGQEKPAVAVDNLDDFVLEQVSHHIVGDSSLLVIRCKDSAIKRPDFCASLEAAARKLQCQVIVTGSDIEQVDVHQVGPDSLVVLHADNEPVNPRFARTLQEQLRKAHGDKVRVSLLVKKQAQG